MELDSEESHRNVSELLLPGPNASPEDHATPLRMRGFGEGFSGFRVPETHLLTRRWLVFLMQQGGGAAPERLQPHDVNPRSGACWSNAGLPGGFTEACRPRLRPPKRDPSPGDDGVLPSPRSCFQIASTTASVKELRPGGHI